jgi:hypothetical protein
MSSDTVRGPLSRPLYIATVTSSERTSGKSSPSFAVSSGIYSLYSLNFLYFVTNLNSGENNPQMFLHISSTIYKLL